MTIFVGGVRVRLIRDNLYKMVRQGLTDLGWFQPGRNHMPISFPPDAVPPEEEVVLNTLSLLHFDTSEREAETGSGMMEFTHTFYADFFGESESLSLHMITDVRDILGGRISAIGRVRPNLVVYNLMQATPTPLFTCQLDGFLLDRPTTFEKSWQRHWRTCRFSVVDYYAIDSEA